MRERDAAQQPGEGREYSTKDDSPRKRTTPHLNASELTGHARRKLEQLQVTSRVKVGTKKMRKWLLSFTLQAWWRDASKNPDDNAVYEVGGVDMEQLEAEGV